MSSVRKGCVRALVHGEQGPRRHRTPGPRDRKPGKERGDVVSRADGREVRDKYAAETELARSLGVFGSPTFVYGNEIFWGDDRLEDAVDWCTSH